MAKYSRKLAERITAFVEDGAYTITDICRMLHINRKTFYEWKKTQPGFEQAICDAEQRRDERLMALARHALEKKLEGYSLTETVYKYIPNKHGQLVLKEKVVKVKEYPPQDKAIMQVMEKGRQKAQKEEEVKKELQPFVVTVRDPEAKEELERNLEILRRGLQSGMPRPFRVKDNPDNEKKEGDTSLRSA